jgi:hypothetical protein
MKKERPTRPPDKTDPEATRSTSRHRKNTLRRTHQRTRVRRQRTRRHRRRRTTTTPQPSSTRVPKRRLPRRTKQHSSRITHHQTTPDPRRIPRQIHRPTRRRKLKKKTTKRRVMPGKVLEESPSFERCNDRPPGLVQYVSADRRVLHVAHTARPAHGMDHSARPQPPLPKMGEQEGLSGSRPEHPLLETAHQDRCQQANAQSGTPRCSASSRTRKTQQGPHSAAEKYARQRPRLHRNSNPINTSGRRRHIATTPQTTLQRKLPKLQ